jgi:hypothetical protein
MSDFKQSDPLECFKPAWNEEEVRWDFIHLLNGKTYSYRQLIHAHECCIDDGPVERLWSDYVRNANRYAVYDMSAEFFLAWLRMAHELNALFYAEEVRLDYLYENPKKGKQSEGVYAAALAEFTDKYKRMK